MDHFEMVEKLRAKANVSYEEAKAALEKSDWDMLDALVLLESEGKVKDAPEAKEYTTQEKKEYSWNTGNGEVKVTFSSALSKLWDWIRKLFQKGNANQFVITRKGDELIAMPITVLALLLICFWPFSLIILFVGLFLGARYSFRGPDINTNVNAFMNKAQDKAASAVEIHVEKNENKAADSEIRADESESKVE
ncbi:MAG: DUF4342 domain-containing protein [Clostridia bacterium]|nr:DUF4342 domain-containing protein [Clostridia bacterium]